MLLHHTYLDSLHLCAERVKQLEEDQSQREYIHFVRIGVPTDLKIQNSGEVSQFGHRITYSVIKQLSTQGSDQLCAEQKSTEQVLTVTAF